MYCMLALPWPNLEKVVSPCRVCLAVLAKQQEVAAVRRREDLKDPQIMLRSANGVEDQAFCNQGLFEESIYIYIYILNI